MNICIVKRFNFCEHQKGNGGKKGQGECLVYTIQVEAREMKGSGKCCLSDPSRVFVVYLLYFLFLTDLLVTSIQ